MKSLLKFQEIKTRKKKIIMRFKKKDGSGFVEFPATQIVAVKKRR